MVVAKRPIRPGDPSLYWAEEEFRDRQCTRCTLGVTNDYRRCLTGVGPRHAKIMFIGEAPGEQEVRPNKRTPFIGAAGNYLDKYILQPLGIDRWDCFFANVVSCRPPGNREPKPEEVEACRELLWKQICAVRPRYIITLGGPALKELTGKKGVTKYRGVGLPLKNPDWVNIDWEVEVFPTLHPSFVMVRSPKSFPLIYTDISRFAPNSSVLPTQLPVRYYDLSRWDDMSHFISEKLHCPELSWDLEAEGLDYWKNNKLICISLSDREQYGYVIPLERPYSNWEDHQLEQVFKKLSVLLTSKRTRYYLFNSKFDLQWLWHFGIPCRCDFDGLVASVALDENLPHSLEANVQFYLDSHFTKDDPISIAGWPWSKIWWYACKDADWTMRLSHVLQPMLEVR